MEDPGAALTARGVTNPDVSEADVNDSTQTKFCTRCQQNLPLTEFHRCRTSSDGLQYGCKNCKAEARAIRAAMSDEEFTAQRARREAQRLAAYEAPLKKCSDCEQLVPRAQFSKNKAMRDGYQNICKTCVSERQMDYRARKPEKMRELGRENMRRRRERDPDGIADYNRSWRAENPELVKAAKKTWQEANHERYRAYANAAGRRWKAANPEKVAATNARWAKENPDLVAAKSRRWRQRHPEVLRAAGSKRRALIRGSKVGPVDLIALWDEQDGVCALCDEPIDRGLKWPDLMSASVDHVIPLARGGPHVQDNLQWVHLGENLRKSASLPD